MDTTTVPPMRSGKTAPKTTKPSETVRTPAAAERPQFRTILVPSVGWPTEASVPSARKRGTTRR